MPITRMSQCLPIADLSFSSCLGPDTLLSITPSISTSGSNILNPLIIAAADLPSDLASSINITGNPRVFAISAVEPSSVVPVNPS